MRSRCTTYECRIYLGGRRGYTGPAIEEAELLKLLADYEHPYKQGLRVTRTVFLGKHGSEPGWEIGTIRMPAYGDIQSTDAVLRVMSDLAEFLLRELGQERVYMVCPDETFLFSR